MPQPLIAGLPPDLDLDSGWEIVLAALDPTTGAAVAGVKVTNASLMVRNLAGGGGSGGGATLEAGAFQLVPGPGA